MIKSGCLQGIWSNSEVARGGRGKGVEFRGFGRKRLYRVLCRKLYRILSARSGLWS